MSKGILKTTCNFSFSFKGYLFSERTLCTDNSEKKNKYILRKYNILVLITGVLKRNSNFLEDSHITLMQHSRNKREDSCFCLDLRLWSFKCIFKSMSQCVFTLQISLTSSLETIHLDISLKCFQVIC